MKAAILFIFGALLGGGIAVLAGDSRLSSSAEAGTFRIGEHTFVFVPSGNSKYDSAYQFGFKCALREVIENWQRPMDYEPWTQPAKSFYDAGHQDGRRLALRLASGSLPSRHAVSEFNRRLDELIRAKEVCTELEESFEPRNFSNKIVDEELPLINEALERARSRLGTGS